MDCILGALAFLVAAAWVAAQYRPAQPARKTSRPARRGYWVCPDCDRRNPAGEEYCVKCGYYLFQEVDLFFDDECDPDDFL